MIVKNNIKPLIDKLYDAVSHIDDVIAALKEIKNIRCEDCKWFGIEYGYTKGWCEMNHGYSIDPDWHCADWKQKDT